MKYVGSFVSGICICIICFYSASTTAWKCDSGEKIEDGWLCDDMLDCIDGSDEKPDTCHDKTCAGNQFRCENSRCIDISYRCDDEVDCGDDDHSDEIGCPTEPPVNCSVDNFKCVTDNQCVPMMWLCDGERDCFDSSDELNCSCKPNNYGCYVRGLSLCLDNATKCDGIEHCDDGRDEKDCTTISKPGKDFECPHAGMYKCRTGDECILWKLVCDAIADCRDSSDEGGLCHANDCAQKAGPGLSKPRFQKACEQNCHESPDGAVCLCGVGFELASDGFHCLDINECAEMLSSELHSAEKFEKIYHLYEYGLNQICSQKCLNLPGTFRCSCVDGYHLDVDGFTCKAIGDYSPDLYIGVDNEIRVFSLRDPGDKTLYYDDVYKSERDDESILYMDVHVATSTLFWVEEKSGELRAKSGMDVATLSLDFKPNSVCVDWVTGNLFVSTKTKRPNHVRLFPAVFLLGLKDEVSKSKDGKVIDSHVLEILSTELDSPVALSVYPQKGILIVADAGHTRALGPRILIANVDGTNVRDLVSRNMLPPTDVIIDYVKDAVIWTSVDKLGNKAKVECIRLDGTQRGVIMSRRKNRFPIDPVSVATFEDRLYVSDRAAREVRSWKTNEIALYGNENTLNGGESVVKPRLARLGAIKIAHPVLQRPLRGVNLCRSSGCSHLCVLVADSLLQTKELLHKVNLKARCLCPSNYKLSKDGKTCEASKAKSDDIVAGNTVSTTTSPTLTAATTTSPWTTTSAVRNMINTKGKSDKMICENPGYVINAIISPHGAQFKTSFLAGSTVWYTCKKGHVVKDGKGNEFSITCLSEGVWSSPLRECMRESTSNKVETPSPKGLKPRPGEAKKASIRDPTTDLSRRQKLCTLSCGPWGRCVKRERGEYECLCLYGKSSSKSLRCLPPQHAAADANSTATPRTTTLESRRLTPSMTALIVVAILLLIAMSLLCCRCIRKKRYSVDLRYFRGRSMKYRLSTPMSSRDSVVIESSVKGKPASITNPNYTSPSQRKRLPKPTFHDDSVSDSGIQQSIGSESTVSDNSVGEGTSGSTPTDEAHFPSTGCPLLAADNITCHDDEEIVDIGQLGIGKPTKSSRISDRIGSLFKMRKTESRECMLPRRKTTRKSRTTYR